MTIPSHSRTPVPGENPIPDHVAERLSDFARLAQLNPEAASYYFPVLDSSCTRHVLLRHRGLEHGAPCLNFASSNYLNLSVRPEVLEAGRKALERYGSGANGAPILSGQYEVHEELEAAIASYHGGEAAALFPSGYVANLGTISTFCTMNDFVAVDARAHASIIDGVRLAQARLYAYPHNKVGALRDRIAAQRDRGATVLVATETIFSMDADLCPLTELVELRRRQTMLLLLDDAHAVGVLGPRGRGGTDHFGVEERDVDLHVGTFSKTFAGIGGYVVGRRDLVQFLKFSARSSLFSANIPPAMASCAVAAIRIAELEGSVLAAAVRAKAARFRAELAKHGIEALGWSQTPIVPVVIPDDDRIVRVALALRARGILVNMVRFPAVPRSQSRLRFVINVGLEDGDLVSTASRLRQILEDTPGR